MFLYEKNKKFVGTFGNNITDPADFIIERNDDKIIMTIGDKIIEGNCAVRIASSNDLKDALTTSAKPNIALVEDTSVVKQISVEHDCTLNLNNKKITFEDSESDVPISCDKGTLVVKDGVLDASDAKPSLVPINAWGGTLILENVTVYSNTKSESCVFCNSGEVIIKSGKYINKNTGTYEYAGGAPLVLNVKNGSGGKITCYGGFFAGRDPALGDDADGGTFVAEGYESVPATVDGYKGFIVRKKS